MCEALRGPRNSGGGWGGFRIIFEGPEGPRAAASGSVSGSSLGPQVGRDGKGLVQTLYTVTEAGHRGPPGWVQAEGFAAFWCR